MSSLKPPDLPLPPWSNRGTCLGCSTRVVFTRDSYIQIGGRRDGSVLLLIETDPLLSLATDINAAMQPGLELLGVAHRSCIEQARDKLEKGEVQLPKELPKISIDDQVDELPALHLPPPTNACAFCAGGPLTEDHIWPRWVSRELSEIGSFTVNSDGHVRTHRSIPVIAKTCGNCNNNWLSVLDNDVKPVLAPLIRGTETVLSSDEQLLLATWGVKTALLIDLASSTPMIPMGCFFDFRLRRTPLANHFVSIAGYKGTRWAAWAQIYPLRLGSTPSEPPNGFVATFTVFRVVFQVVGHFTRGGATFSDNRQVASALSYIWPSTATAIAWPRNRLAFGDDSLKLLTTGFTS